MVDCADHGVVRPDFVSVERMPLAIRPLRQVGQDRMDMELGIERAARVVLKECVDQIAGLHRLRFAVLRDARFSEVLLDP